jgi:hypothetical protein
LRVDREVTGLLAGAAIALGIMLVIPGLLGPGPELTAYLLGIPLAAIWIALLTNAAAIPSISQRAYLCAFVAGLVHLTASGGWLAPGVTNILAMIAGMILVSAGPNAMRLAGSPFGPSVQTGDRMSRIGALVAVCLAVGTLFAFSKTSWQPIQRSTAVQSRMAISFDQAEQNVRQAVALDPWNPAYRAGLVGLLFVELGQNTRQRRATSVEIEELEKAADELVASDPHSWRVHFEIGRQASLHAGRVPELGEMALRHFRQAAELSPQDASQQLQVALVGWLMGDRKLASERLERAFKIDKDTPHRDQKIQGLLVWWPSDFAPRSVGDSELEWKSVGRDKSIGDGWVRAEPLADFLRTQLD